ncbi:vegetative cell wall protein gp1-like [Eucalyptus grandis]|uniref:vegetative cell wall protein gp1-like n=1 Tax=Eucalyptus grandis TaxID=71139 RepID=UPI00192E7E1C|nr:vegetative cell wall protein gp1-like [Eucalyptus grandis]
MKRKFVKGIIGSKPALRLLPEPPAATAPTPPAPPASGRQPSPPPPRLEPAPARDPPARNSVSLVAAHHLRASTERRPPARQSESLPSERRCCSPTPEAAPPSVAPPFLFCRASAATAPLLQQPPRRLQPGAPAAPLPEHQHSSLRRADASSLLPASAGHRFRALALSRLRPCFAAPPKPTTCSIPRAPPPPCCRASLCPTPLLAVAAAPSLEPA